MPAQSWPVPPAVVAEGIVKGTSPPFFARHTKICLPPGQRLAVEHHHVVHRQAERVPPLADAALDWTGSRRSSGHLSGVCQFSPGDRTPAGCPSTYTAVPFSSNVPAHQMPVTVRHLGPQDERTLAHLRVENSLERFSNEVSRHRQVVSHPVAAFSRRCAARPNPYTPS